MNQLYEKYGKRYEDLIYDVMRFFIDNTIKSIHDKKLINFGINHAFNFKCVMDFVLKYEKTYRTVDDLPVQPFDVFQICEILSRTGYLSKIELPSFINIDKNNSFYLGFGRGIDNYDKNTISKRLNSIVYGFPYIYNSNKNVVVQLVTKRNTDEEEHVGTCFKTYFGYVTAKHCVDRFDVVKINNIIINHNCIYKHPDVDLALIIPDNYDCNGYLMIGEGNVLDEVLALGYPKMSGFMKFLNGTVGSITAIENTYLSRCKLMLITCPVRGGNSGGPLLNKYGEVVGVITDSPDVEGDKMNYDNFGYGCVTPIEYLNDILSLVKK